MTVWPYFFGHLAERTTFVDSPTSHTPSFISSIDASAHFNVTNDYIGALCRKGKVDGQLNGRTWYVNPDSLAAYLKEMDQQREERRRQLSEQLKSKHPGKRASAAAAFLAPTMRTAFGIALVVTATVGFSYVIHVHATTDGVVETAARHIANLSRGPREEQVTHQVPSSRPSTDATSYLRYLPQALADTSYAAWNTTFGTVTRCYLAALDTIGDSEANAYRTIGAAIVPRRVEQSVGTYSPPTISPPDPSALNSAADTLRTELSHVVPMQSPKGDDRLAAPRVARREDGHAATAAASLSNSIVRVLRAFTDAAYEGYERTLDVVSNTFSDAGGALRSALAQANSAQEGNQSASAWNGWTDWVARLLYPAPQVADIQPSRQISLAGAPGPLAEAPSIAQHSNAQPTAAQASVHSVDTNSSAPSAQTLASYVTQDSFARQLQELDNSLRSLVYEQTAKGITVPPYIAAGGTGEGAGRIDTLSGVAITNATITSGSIPDLSGSYLSLGGGAVTGTSSFAASLGIGTSSPSDSLAINGPVYLADSFPGNVTNRLYQNGSTLYWNGSPLGLSGGQISTSSINTWTALQKLYGNASTTGLSSNYAYFGATATSSFASDGALTLAQALAVSSGGTGVSIPSVAGFPVEAYGAVGDGSTDDAAAIQSAISAACNANGGKVIFGAKIYAISTTLSITCPDVFLVGQGAGGPLAAGNPSSYTTFNHYGATVLKWIGSSGGAMVDFEPLNNAVNNIKGGGADEIVLAGYGVAGIGLELRSTNGLQFSHLTVENVTVSGVDLNITSHTLTGGNPYDTQQNHFGQVDILLNWNMPAVRNANGVYLDGGESANSSFNVFDSIYGTIENGDLVNLANADTNTFYTIRGFQPNAYSGNTVEFQASTSASGAARDNTIFYVQELNHGNIQADGNGGSGSSSRNTVFEINAGNGGGRVPIIQSGASLIWMNDKGQHGLIDTNGTIGGYNWDGSQFIYASSTNFSTILGLDAGSGLNATSTVTGNTAIGNSALAAITSGINNTAVGYQALHANTTGSPNSAFGVGALFSNTTGRDNNAFGKAALNNSTTANQNEAFGDFALQFDTTGANNIAIGHAALAQNQTGGTNVAIGNQAGTGVSGNSFSNAVLVGGNAGFALTTGNNNIFLGRDAASTTASGSNNIALGYDIALPSTNGSNQLDIGNLIFGTNINGQATTVSTGNIGIGTTTPWGRFSITGADTSASTPAFIAADTNNSPLFAVLDNGSVGIGTTSPSTTFGLAGSQYLTGGLGVGSLNTTAGSIVASATTTALNYVASGLGSAGAPAFTFSGNTNTGVWSPGSNILAWSTAGTERLRLDASGNLGIGKSPSFSLDVNGFVNVDGTAGGYKQAGNTILYASSTIFGTFVGQGAGAQVIANATSSDVTSGPQSAAFGYQALGNATSSANQSTAVGYQALLGSATISNVGANTAVGWQALKAVTSGHPNNAFGVSALTSNTSGNDNNAFGKASLTTQTTASQNEGFGDFALQFDTTGSNNVAIGHAALAQNQTGGTNVAIGNQAGTGVSGNSFSNAVLVGGSAGFALTTGNNNIFLGRDAASTTASGSNNIALGYQIDLPSTNGSNQLDIGNLIFGTGINGTVTTVSTGNIAVGTTTPYARLSVWGPDAASSTLAFNVVNSASTTVFAVFDGGNAQLSGTLTQSSDQRLKTNVQSLDASTTLSLIDALKPVTFNWIDPNRGADTQMGLIAQQVQPIFPALVSTTTPTALTPDGTLGVNYIGFIAPIIKAIQALYANVLTLQQTIAGFAQSFTSAVGQFGQLHTQTLCVSKADGSEVCVTGDQIAALLTQQGSYSAPSAGVAGRAQQGTSTPPTIQLAGANPAVIHVGDSYSDLGATATDSAGHDLGLKYFLDGALVSNIVIDTSAAATDTIDYVATDTWGNIATSTRTVVIEAAIVPPAPTATSTATSTAQ